MPGEHDLSTLRNKDWKCRRYLQREGGNHRTVDLKPEEDPEQPNQNGGSYESRQNNRHEIFHPCGNGTQAPRWRGQNKRTQIKQTFYSLVKMLTHTGEKVNNALSRITSSSLTLPGDSGGFQILMLPGNTRFSGASPPIHLRSRRVQEALSLA
jgi:hypothetical protein